MDKSEIIVTDLHTRPASFSARCPECGITEEATSHATGPKDKAEMNLIAQNVARRKIIRHLKEKHGIEVK